MNRHEEFYAAIMFLVERHYLRKHSKFEPKVILLILIILEIDASFSENFYGLKRRRRPCIDTERASAAVGGIPPGESLRSREIGRSLWFLVRIRSVSATVNSPS